MDWLVANGLNEQAAAALLLCDGVTLADGGNAPVQLVLIFFAVYAPHAQRSDQLADQEVAAAGHGHGLDKAEGGLGAPAAADGGANVLADVVPSEKKLPRRNGLGGWPCERLSDDVAMSLRRGEPEVVRPIRRPHTTIVPVEDNLPQSAHDRVIHRRRFLFQSRFGLQLLPPFRLSPLFPIHDLRRRRAPGQPHFHFVQRPCAGVLAQQDARREALAVDEAAELHPRGDDASRPQIWVSHEDGQARCMAAFIGIGIAAITLLPLQ